MSQTKLKITAYSDYICPFCYIGYHRIEQLKKEYNIDVEWKPFEIHPETASKYEISSGEVAEVQTANGKIQLKAHITAGIRHDTINIPQGWEEANANELTGAEDADPISGFPNLKSLRCRIRKI